MPEHEMTLHDEEKMIQDAYDELLDGYLKSNHRKKVEIIERAFNFAKEAHAGVRRRSGEPYILHPIAVARIASREIGLGSTSICAALLHDVVEDTEYTVEDIEQHFGKKIAQLVAGLTKISGGIFGDRASAQAENFRKLLLTMSEDIRVILIKMADRLHNMRTLGSMAPNKQYKIAGETLYVYAPLAHRLGLFAIKTELEELSFKYEHPMAYERIKAQIAESENRRSKVYKDFSAPITRRLKDMGLDFEAHARVKSVYSIWRKMETKHIPFEEVYDLYAMRIVFKCDDPAKEKTMCWNIYSAITDIYKLHPQRTRDWVSVPKANGYQALHVTVMGPDGNWVEIQIRSERMDDIAEKGFAAHWRYKVGEGDEESELTVWLKTIKDLLKDPNPNGLDFLDTLKLNLFSNEIVVFTPKGKLITLPSSATVLDMAFALHTELGIRCIAGKVNHKLVPLSHRLKSGDQVEVITSNSQKPNPDWLNFLATAKAKTRLRAAIRKDRQPMIDKGAEIYQSFLADNGITDSNEVVTRALGFFRLNNRDELFYRLGRDEISMEDCGAHFLSRTKQPENEGILSKMLRLGRKATSVIPGVKALSDNKNTGSVDKRSLTVKPEKINMKETYVLVDDENGRNFVMAQCCAPVPGDDVMGYVNDDGLVEIHNLDCPKAQLLKASFGPRIVSTRWHTVTEHYLAKVHIEGFDRKGLLQELISMISSHLNINIRSLDIKTKGAVFSCDLAVMVSDTATVDSLVAKVSAIDGIDRAARIAN